MIRILKVLTILIIISSVSLFITSCSDTGENESLINFKVMDSSISGLAKSLTALDEEYSSIFVSIVRIELIGEGITVELENFENSPLPLNLLELGPTGTIIISDVGVGEGIFSQVRIIIEAPEENQGPPANLQSYLTFEDDPAEYPLFVPSGSQTGLNITLQPALEVGTGQSFEITLDFNSENSIYRTGMSDRHIIRPTSMSATISEITS